MIVTEYFKTRSDGVVLNRTYSDAGFYIKQDGTGNKYAEAVDVSTANRTYTETDIPVESGSADEIDPDEAVSAVKILLGMEE